MSDAIPTPSPQTRRRARLAGIVAAVVAVLVVALGLIARGVEARKLRQWTDGQAVPTVNAVTPERGPAGDTLTLPGRLEAYARAPLYARVSGYVKAWKADIGTPVKAGQLLAELETPDVDQQLLQARADLASAQANAALARTTAERWQAMLASDSVSRQEVDEKTGDYAAKQALVNAAKANVDRLAATKDFARIVAPFDGVVTARNTDVGALVNAGAGGGPELFEVSDTRKLRVYVQVPQSYAPSVRPGAAAKLAVPEHPGRDFRARVEAVAQAVQASSGSMLVQLIVDNAAGELLPGGYANVSFTLPAPATALRIPASALVFDQQGLRVATLDGAGKVKFKTVSILRDLGKSVEIGSGLDPSDRVIDSPPDGLADGDAVQLAGKDADGKPAGKTHADA
jgi:RND family efflux transporter MFP subunit